MLSEADKLLITAGVCGQVSRAEKTALRILLEESPAAKKLYKALCRDRDRLAALPKQPAPESVWSSVMARVASGPIIVTPKVRAGQGAGWLPYAIAASLLVAVAGGSYWVFSGQKGKHDFADNTPLPKVGTLPNPADSALTVNSVPGKAPEFVGPPKPDVAMAMAPMPTELAPAPRNVGTRDPFTAAVPDPTVFTTIDARLPVLFPIADAANAEVVRKVKAEFAAGNALRLDLFAKDTHRAADLFATAIRAGGTQLAVDGVTQEYLKRKLPLAWTVYTESLTAPDALAVLKRLADADAKPGTTVVWTAAHLSSASAADGREAKDLFGLDPAAWKKAKPNTSGDPLAAGTLNQVTAALNKPAASNAVMTTFLPNNLRIPPTLSPQIKKFFDDKPTKKDGAVPLLVVIRPAS